MGSHRPGTSRKDRADAVLLHFSVTREYFDGTAAAEKLRDYGGRAVIL